MSQEDPFAELNQETDEFLAADAEVSDVESEDGLGQDSNELDDTTNWREKWQETYARLQFRQSRNEVLTQLLGGHRRQVSQQRDEIRRLGRKIRELEARVEALTRGTGRHEPVSIKQTWRSNSILEALTRACVDVAKAPTNVS